MMMKRIFPIVLLLAVASCGEGRQDQSLTLMSYNVGVFSKYQDNSMPEVARLIRDSGADLVGLNELDSCNRRHADFQLKELSDEMGGWPYLFASAFPFAGGGYGNGVLSSIEIQKSYRVALPQGDGSEPRSMAVVETARCVFASLHLDHRSTAAALSQMQVVNDWFIGRYKGCSKPVFLCGDFNVTPDSEVIALAQTAWTLLSGTGNTHSTTHPRHCIDYIFSFRHAVPVQVEEARVLTEGTASLSDHFPVLVRIRF